MDLKQLLLAGSIIAASAPLVASELQAVSSDLKVQAAKQVINGSDLISRLTQNGFIDNIIHVGGLVMDGYGCEFGYDHQRGSTVNYFSWLSEQGDYTIVAKSATGRAADGLVQITLLSEDGVTWGGFSFSPDFFSPIEPPQPDSFVVEASYTPAQSYAANVTASLFSYKLEFPETMSIVDQFALLDQWADLMRCFEEDFFTYIDQQPEFRPEQ